LDTGLLHNAIRVGGVDCNGNGAAVGDLDYDSDQRRPRKGAVLCVAVSCGICDLATPLKSFAAHGRQRSAVYSKVKVGKLAILGAGAWGTALAWLWSKGGREIVLWGHNADRVARMRKARENVDYLPGLRLPESVHVTPELRDCARVDLIVFVTPSTVLRHIANALGKLVENSRAIILTCTKGIEHVSGMRMSEILHEVFPDNTVAALSGPNLAAEVAQNLPTATVVACDNLDCAVNLQAILGNARFRVYTSEDVISVELGGALKNVFALAAGISDGLGLGDNSKAALITRSLAELVRLGVAMGGNADSFYGLSGAGDLIVTCYSECSRNHTVGKRLGRGESLDDIVASMKSVAEGIPTARSAWEMAQRLNVSTPIIDQVYAVLYEQRQPTIAVEELLRREQKPEQV
jgi:glycerol-3-phosphate dehydrogenase (NAD(P)+)